MVHNILNSIFNEVKNGMNILSLTKLKQNVYSIFNEVKAELNCQGAMY